MFCFIETLTHHLFYWLKKFDLIEPPSQTPLTPVMISLHLHLLLQKKDQESNKRKQEINVCIVYWDFGENYEHDESLRWLVLCFLLVEPFVAIVILYDSLTLSTPHQNHEHKGVNIFIERRRIVLCCHLVTSDQDEWGVWRPLGLKDINIGRDFSDFQIE